MTYPTRKIELGSTSWRSSVTLKWAASWGDARLGREDAMVLFKTTKVPRKTIHILVFFVQLYGFVGSPGGKEWRIGVFGLVEEDAGEGSI
jgi:hypothetical protein